MILIAFMQYILIETTISIIVLIMIKTYKRVHAKEDFHIHIRKYIKDISILALIRIIILLGVVGLMFIIDYVILTDIDIVLEYYRFFDIFYVIASGIVVFNVVGIIHCHIKQKELFFNKLIVLMNVLLSIFIYMFLRVALI